MGNAVAYVVRSIDDDSVKYYTGAGGRFSYDIRRAKMYPTPKSAEASYPFTTRKRYPDVYWSDKLDTHKISLIY